MDNDAILADKRHEPIYEEIVREHQVVYVPGGAAQNAARGAAYVLPPNSVVFAGCAYWMCIRSRRGRKLELAPFSFTGHHRSMVTTLRVAKDLDEEHLWSPAVASLIDSARVVYLEGYLLTHRPEISIRLGKKVSAANKILVLNLSAPYIPRLYNAHIQEIAPYCDIIISNEAEAEAWATINNHPDPTNYAPRIVIITHGAKSTTAVSAQEPDVPRVYPVQPLKEEEIVDTNAAGDAFAGIWIVCIETGHKLAAMCIGQEGPQYKWPKVNIL
ncbi:Ribokinase-like protein [Gymnopus androsaceus JB14]|uniref:Adenosine kinase n=1 Tax=Gymnopus androsaceus JB14 TaxID=1447944 RepID=A0A6A4HIQ3_9AGAR|nr:Ribokinase-like protein [Gymnopus androsaceus JB14]